MQVKLERRKHQPPQTDRQQWRQVDLQPLLQSARTAIHLSQLPPSQPPMMTTTAARCRSQPPCCGQLPSSFPLLPQLGAMTHRTLMTRCWKGRSLWLRWVVDLMVVPLKQIGGLDPQTGGMEEWLEARQVDGQQRRLQSAAAGERVGCRSAP